MSDRTVHELHALAQHNPDNYVGDTCRAALEEIAELRAHIEVLISGPRRSSKIISAKYGQFEPITATVTKGQVIAAIEALSRTKFQVSATAGEGE